MSPNLPITIRLILDEFDKRGVQWKLTDSGTPSLFMEFSNQGGRTRYLRASLTDTISAIGLQIADDKLMTTAIASRLQLQVPETIVYKTMDDARDFVRRHGAMVVKPLDSAHGNGVSVGVTEVALAEAMERARRFSKYVILQQQITGRDLRLLYIGGTFVAAAERTPASVTGDGAHTVAELIELANAQLGGEERYHQMQDAIPLDAAKHFLGDQASAVPPQDKVVQVIGTANTGSGGVATDVTDTVPEAMVSAGKRMVDELRLGVCGVDFIANDDGAYLIELNTAPGFRMHHSPHAGQPRNVTAPFVDWLLADKEYPC